MDVESNRKVVDLSIDDILPNRYQPRIKFDDDAIFELAESIKVHGVFQPILVRPIGDKYEIIAGERRYKASVLAGKTTIPAIVMSLNDKDTVEIALIENVQRSNLTPIEEAISYKKILDMGYIKQEDLARKLGKNQSTIANKLRLLNLDESVQDALIENKISERHARSLLRLKSSTDQKIMLRRIINERLTVRRTDEEIEKMRSNFDEEELSPVIITDVKEEMNMVEELPEIEVTPVESSSINSIFGFSDVAATPVNAQTANQSTVISSTPAEKVETVEVVDPDINKIEQSATPVFEEYAMAKKEHTDMDKLLEPEPVKEEEIEIESQPVFTGKFFNFDPIAEPKEETNGKNAGFNFDNFVEPEPIVNDSNTAPSFEDFFNNQNTVTMSDEKPTETPAKETFSEDIFNMGVVETKPAETPVENTIEEFKAPAEMSVEAPVTEETKVETPVFEEAKEETSTDSADDDIVIPMASELSKDTAAEAISFDDAIVVPNSEVSKPNISEAINIVRDAVSKLESIGFNVDVDELDLESLYQMMIKIDK